MDKSYKYTLAFQNQNLKYEFLDCSSCVVKVMCSQVLVDGHHIVRSLRYLNAHSSIN